MTERTHNQRKKLKRKFVFLYQKLTFINSYCTLKVCITLKKLCALCITTMMKNIDIIIKYTIGFNWTQFSTESWVHEIDKSQNLSMFQAFLYKNGIIYHFYTNITQ